MRVKNEIGKKYGKLTVVEKAYSKHNNMFWKCICDCGLTTIVCGTYLRNGHTTSCGCVKKQFFNEKHNYSDKERLYYVWEQMRSRCYNPNNPRYQHYGNKGITICDEWTDYKMFRDWAYKNGYYDTLPNVPRGKHCSIDRIDPNKGYNPENCRIISLSDNTKHRFNNL